MINTIFTLICAVAWAVVTYCYALPKTRDKPIAMMMAGLYPMVVLVLFMFALTMIKLWEVK